MERTVRFFLIAILATATTAKYEYNSKYVEKIHKDLQKLKTFNAKLYNTDALVKWKVDENPQADVVFQVKDPAKSSGPNCGGRPAITIDDGPMHCLFEMVFYADTNGQENLQLGLAFRDSEYVFDWRLVLMDVLVKPENEQAEDLPGVVHVIPITKEQLARARDRKSFVGPISWAKTIVERGIHAVNIESKEELEEDSDSESSGEMVEREILVFTTYPTVMDSKTVKEVLELPSELGIVKKGSK